MENANLSKLTTMHFYAWKSGLKRGMYYLRTKSAVDAIKFTLSKETKSQEIPKEKLSVQSASEPTENAKTLEAAVDDSALSPEELRELIAQSKEAEGDDCLMCGS